jgi:GNAT superfamily N-acetyltransferase
MLLVARSIGELDFFRLMEVYIEGNSEKAEDGLTLLEAEQDFRQYLREDFFKVSGAAYYVWVEDGQYISALRLEPYKDGLLLEALETTPERRRMGYAGRLIRAVLEVEPRRPIYAHVAKRNVASLKVHGRCGFRRLLEYATYIDGSVHDRACTMILEE